MKYFIVTLMLGVMTLQVSRAATQIKPFHCIGARYILDVSQQGNIPHFKLTSRAGGLKIARNFHLTERYVFADIELPVTVEACQQDGFILKCSHADKGLEITFSNQEGGSKKVTVSNTKIYLTTTGVQKKKESGSFVWGEWERNYYQFYLPLPYPDQPDYLYTEFVESFSEKGNQSDCSFVN